MKKNYVSLSVRIPPEKHEIIRELSHKQRISMNDVINFCLDKYLKKVEEKVARR